MNCTYMCIMVTKRGNGKPKCSCENIHLLYTERIVAKKYLEKSKRARWTAKLERTVGHPESYGSRTTKL